MKKPLALAAAVAVVLAVIFLPGLARRLDASLEPARARTAELDGLYRDLTNAFPIASEMPEHHPAAVRWRECRTRLLEAGYLETREFPMQDRLKAKGASTAFFNAFNQRFFGLECAQRAPKSDEAVAVITARKKDFSSRGIEMFVREFRHDPP